MKKVLLILSEEEHAVLKEVKGSMTWEEFVLRAAEAYKFGDKKYG